MISDLAKRLIGENGGATMSADIAPVETGAPMLSNPDATGARRKISTMKPDKKKKLHNSMVSALMGLKEDRDGAVIPDDAQEVKTLEVSDHGLNLDAPEIPGQKIRNPYSGEEPLILPIASLVAPDVTPEGIFPLDPSQVPGADQGHAPVEPPLGAGGMPMPGAGHNDAALNVILGKPSAPAAAGIAGPVPASATTSDRMSTESVSTHFPGVPSPAEVAASSTAASGDALLGASQPMPDHKASGIETVMEAYSRFIPRTTMKFE